MQYERIGKLFGKTALACRICMHHTKKDVKSFGADEVFSEDFPKRRARLMAEGRARERQEAVSQGSRPSNPRPRGQSSRAKATESRDDAINSPINSPLDRTKSLPHRSRAKSDPSRGVSAAELVSQVPLPSVVAPKPVAWGNMTEPKLKPLWKGPDGMRMSEQEAMLVYGSTPLTHVAYDERETGEAQASKPPTHKGPARKDRASKYLASKAEASAARVRKPESKRSRGKVAAATTWQVSPEAPKFSGKKYPEPAPKFALG